MCNHYLFPNVSYMVIFFSKCLAIWQWSLQYWLLSDHLCFSRFLPVNKAILKVKFCLQCCIKIFWFDIESISCLYVSQYSKALKIIESFYCAIFSKTFLLQNIFWICFMIYNCTKFSIEAFFPVSVVMDRQINYYFKVELCK